MSSRALSRIQHALPHFARRKGANMLGEDTVDAVLPDVFTPSLRVGIKTQHHPYV